MAYSAEFKEHVISLRENNGLSYSEIGEKTGVPKSTLSGWLHHIILTQLQRDRLEGKRREGGEKGRRHFHGANLGTGAWATQNKWLKKRQSYQQEGREMARQITDPLFTMGCTMYWAEGTKARTAMRFSNSDPNMVKTFVRFLQSFFSPPVNKITLYIQAYDGNGVTKEQIGDFWVKETGLPRTCLGKIRLLASSDTGRGSKNGRSLTGTCCVYLGSVEVIQKIYGAIQELTGLDNPAWVL
jgi:transposase-like protein